MLNTQGRRTSAVEASKEYPKAVHTESKLTEEENKIYGNRIPHGFSKVSLLGKGGCALVWLGNKCETGKKVAIKQFAKLNGFKSQSDVESFNVEIEIGRLLFKEDGSPRDDP
eukprot:TRINITY_DN7610_c0_g1_i1.p4 TRINITY_DN7610_c0_g1~~TRINITY_DN7610_c0_g1_i1.p4  ORF type:complete len:112 (-),score=23.77 TRINITY_DN7610_c0_g1_i1:455-790(-)